MKGAVISEKVYCRNDIRNHNCPYLGLGYSGYYDWARGH